MCIVWAHFSIHLIGLFDSKSCAAPEERSAPQDKAQQLQTMRLRFALLKAVSVETFLRHDQVASVLEVIALRLFCSPRIH